MDAANPANKPHLADGDVIRKDGVEAELDPNAKSFEPGLQKNFETPKMDIPEDNLRPSSVRPSSPPFVAQPPRRISSRQEFPRPRNQLIPFRRPPGVMGRVRRKPNMPHDLSRYAQMSGLGSTSPSSALAVAAARQRQARQRRGPRMEGHEAYMAAKQMRAGGVPQRVIPDNLRHLMQENHELRQLVKDLRAILRQKLWEELYMRGSTPDTIHGDLEKIWTKSHQRGKEAEIKLSMHRVSLLSTQNEDLQRNLEDLRMTLNKSERERDKMDERRHYLEKENQRLRREMDMQTLGSR